MPHFVVWQTARGVQKILLEPDFANSQQPSRGAIDGYDSIDAVDDRDSHRQVTKDDFVYPSQRGEVTFSDRAPRCGSRGLIGLVPHRRPFNLRA